MPLIGKKSAKSVSYFTDNLLLTPQIQNNIIQLLQLSFETQDQIIEEISQLNCCSQSEIYKIICRYK